jgi:hypothetical protein
MLDSGLAHGLDIVKKRGQNGLHLRELMGVVGRDDQFHIFSSFPLFVYVRIVL